MNIRVARRSSWMLLVLLLSSVLSLQGQVGDLDWRLNGGVALPLSSFGDYFEFGPTVGVDVGYPVQDRLSLLLQLDLDVINRHQFYPTPDIQFWRYRLGLEGDLADPEGTGLLQAYAGVGAATFRSTEFWPDNVNTRAGLKIRKTSFSGTGGVRLGLRTGSGLVWWLSGEFNWAPFDEDEKGILQDAVRNSLTPIGSATSVAITLGFNLNR